MGTLHSVWPTFRFPGAANTSTFFTLRPRPSQGFLEEVPHDQMQFSDLSSTPFFFQYLSALSRCFDATECASLFLGLGGEMLEFRLSTLFPSLSPLTKCESLSASLLSFSYLLPFGNGCRTAWLGSTHGAPLSCTKGTLFRGLFFAFQRQLSFSYLLPLLTP